LRSFIENSNVAKSLLKVIGVLGVSLVMAGTLSISPLHYSLRITSRLFGTTLFLVQVYHSRARPRLTNSRWCLDSGPVHPRRDPRYQRCTAKHIH
jgi:uncharacterized membrane protein HdeD (DUF308 family)